MIKVINGLRYNTETSELVFHHSNGLFSTDFRYRTKDLYRTKKGNWFLHHVGGPMTDMAVPVGNNGRGGGEDIEPIHEDHAFRFLQAHSDDSDAIKAIETYFNDRVEDA